MAAGADVTEFAVTGPVTFFGTTSMGENFDGTVSTMGGNPNAPLSFLGVTTTTPNDYVTSPVFSDRQGSNQSIIVDNVFIGTAIPEPTSMQRFVAQVLGDRCRGDPSAARIGERF